MTNKLAKLDRNIPLRAIPEQELNTIILTSFLTWLADILSLTDEVSAKRLKTALPAIKEHCWSMGFSEIKKMFELYADNKLSIEPIPNYFDRILFGKIVSAYKQQRKVKPKEIKMPELSQEEKDNLTYMGVVNCFDRFTQTNDIMNGYTWVYDHLESIGVLKYSDKEKRSIMPIATERLKIITKELYGLEEYKTLIRDLEAKRNGGAVIVVAKKMLLERFFMKITSKNKHIKDYLK
jgi:hypothetical protein